MKLYNNVTNNDGLIHLSHNIENMIDQSSRNVIDLVDDKSVKSAINQMKPKKRDSTFDVTSDMYRHGPDIHSFFFIRM